MLFAGDQKVEHLNSDFYGEGIHNDDGDPEHLFKIAAGANGIVLDVKVGHGAFMRTEEDAHALAVLMVDIGRRVGRRVRAVISDMNQPLGRAIGNALELEEALDTLQGRGPADFREHCLTVAGQMLQLTGQVADDTELRAQLTGLLTSQRAFAKFREWIAAQQGDLQSVDDPGRLPAARFQREIPAPRTGYIAGINAREVGLTSMLLGGGRAKKGDQIDHAVGIVLHAKVGEGVTEGQPLLTIHANDEGKLAGARQRLLSAYEWSDKEIDPLPLLHRSVG